MAGSFALEYHKYRLDVDGINYITIAQKYYTGDIKNAVNGYYGPLFSWLLVPFLVFGLDPLLASKILLLAIGLVIILAVQLFSYRFEMGSVIRGVILFSSIPIILSFALHKVSGDLPLVFFLIIYFYFLFDPNYANRKNSGLLCGITGALSYLTKPYALPFFIVHFLSLNAIMYLNSRARDEKNKYCGNSPPG